MQHLDDHERLVQDQLLLDAVLDPLGLHQPGRHGVGHLHGDRLDQPDGDPGQLRRALQRRPRCRRRSNTAWTRARSPRVPTRLTITLPNGYYQVDFVCGAAISQFGPSSSSVLSYHGENRFISSDNDGWNAPTGYVAPPLANLQNDIGSVAAPGTLSYNNGSYTVTADGNDIWNNADAFNYVYQTLSGDGEIIAKVDGISSSDAWAKAGLMIRQSLDASSAQASVFSTPGNGVAFQDRETQGASSNNWAASNSYGASSYHRRLPQARPVGQYLHGLRFEQRRDLDGGRLRHDQHDAGRSTSAWPSARTMSP